MYPGTVGGRVAAVVASLLANVLVAVLVAIIYQSLYLLPHESRMVIFLQRVASLRDMETRAAVLIQRRYRLFRAQADGSASRLSVLQKRALVVQAMSDFHARRAAHQSHSSTLDLSQLFRTMLEGIEADMRALKASGGGGAPQSEVMEGVSASARQPEQLSGILEQQQKQQQSPGAKPSSRRSMSRLSTDSSFSAVAGAGAAGPAASARARLADEVASVQARMTSMEENIRAILAGLGAPREAGLGAGAHSGFEGADLVAPLTPSPQSTTRRVLPGAEYQSLDSTNQAGGAGRLRPL